MRRKNLRFADTQEGGREALLGLRDRTYIEESKPVFEDMRQIVNQLSGLLLVSHAVHRHGFVVGDLLFRSQSLFADVREAFDSVTSGPRSGHHHLHLRNAIEALTVALTAAQESASGLHLGDRGLNALKVAWRELIHASDALPGFDRVDLSQSCCAQHFRNSSQPTFSCQGAIP